MVEVVIKTFVVASKGFSLLTFALVFVLECADVVSQFISCFILLGSEVLVLSFSVTEFVFSLAEFYGSIVVLAFELVEACVVGT